MSNTTVDPLSYYGRHNCSLFPIPAGQKDPVGIVGSFAHDCSTSPEQWGLWSAAHPGCNFGLVAGPSRLVIVDVDVSKIGREAAWAAWYQICSTWGVPAPFMPHVQSARGGWHILFSVPGEVDASSLRQRRLADCIDVRAANGFVVAAGSYYDGTARGEASGHYVLLAPDCPPHPAPAALLQHVAPAAASASAAGIGTRDRGDVGELLRWLTDRDQFDAYEDWCGVGMALKLEFGDQGLDLWRSVTWDDVDDSTIATKWNSFASEPTPGVQTLASWLNRAHGLGWRGTVRKSASSMFAGVTVDAVAALAAGAGASLPLPPGVGLPMMAGQEVLCNLAGPVVDEFLSATAAEPDRPAAGDFPALPDSLSTHGLYVPLQSAIARIMAMAESPRSFRGSRVIDTLAVLSLVHADVFDSVCRRIRTLGCKLPQREIKLAAINLQERVEREFVTQDAWICDIKSGQIESDNSDNVAVFLGIIGCEIRWNGWLERSEIRALSGEFAGIWSGWTKVDDTVVARLRTRANRTKTRFRPSKDFLWESLLALSHALAVDPMRDELDRLQREWDGIPRLLIWLSACCGVPCDPYHQAVGKNIIGGMVRRVRQPGCKHDTMVVFYGPQGTGKSTMAAMLAMREEWFTDAVLLGDASKELVLSLAGKCVVEISEMGMRGSTNATHVKAMISRQVDAGRPAYARTVSERPRRNVFVGTTNDNEPLVDPTGNRRFLPVRVDQHVNLGWLADNLPALIGEAAALEAAGATFALPSAVWALAAERQEAARGESDVEIAFADWFAPGQFTHVGFITSNDLRELCEMAGLRGSNSSRGEAMRALGFRQDSAYLGGKKTRLWFRGPVMMPSNIEKHATRFTPGKTPDGRARVSIGRGG